MTCNILSCKCNVKLRMFRRSPNFSMINDQIHCLQIAAFELNWASKVLLFQKGNLVNLNTLLGCKSDMPVIFS